MWPCVSNLNPIITTDQFLITWSFVTPYHSVTHPRNLQSDNLAGRYLAETLNNIGLALLHFCYSTLLKHKCSFVITIILPVFECAFKVEHALWICNLM